MNVFQKIKKYLVSSALVLLFVFYVIYQRVNDAVSRKPLVNLPVQNNLSDNLPTNMPATTPDTSLNSQLRNIINRFRDGEDDEEGGKIIPKPVQNSTASVVTTAPSAVQSPVCNTTTVAPAKSIAGTFKDGVYTGASMDVYYGNVQVQAIIQNGKLADVKFLDYPSNRQHSADLAAYAMPILRTEAIKAQSANVDVVSGATATSTGFKESLASALALAKN